MNFVRKVLMVLIVTVFLIIGSPIESVINYRKIDLPKYSLPKPAMPKLVPSQIGGKILSEHYSSGSFEYIMFEEHLKSIRIR